MEFEELQNLQRFNAAHDVNLRNQITIPRRTNPIADAKLNELESMVLEFYHSSTIHNAIQSTLETRAQVINQPKIKTGVEAIWEVNENDDGVAVTLQLDFAWPISKTIEMDDMEITRDVDFECDRWIRHQVFTILTHNHPVGYKVEIPNANQQKMQESNIFVIEVKKEAEEKPEYDTPLPTVPVEIMQSPPKSGVFKQNTWANIISDNGLPKNDLFNKLVAEAKDAAVDDYQQHYADILVLNKIREMAKTQKSISQELALWAEELLQMQNLKTRVLSSGDNMEAVQLNLGDLVPNVFNIAFAPDTQEIADPEVEQLLSAHELTVKFQEMAQRLGIKEPTKEVYENNEVINKSAVPIWVHGITIEDKEFALNQDAVLKQVTLVYNFFASLIEQNKDAEAKSHFETHIIENAMACADRSKAGLINLRNIRRIASLDSSSNTYADTLIDLLLQEHKKFIFQTYLQDSVGGEASDDESVETYLKRMTLFDHVFNLGFKSTMLHEGSAKPGSYSQIIDLFFKNDWFNFRAIFEESIFQNELLKEWCAAQNTKEFGSDAAEFVSRDEKGMLKYCVFTKTNFVDKYLLSMDDYAHQFIEKFMLTSKIAEEKAIAKAERIRRMSEKRKEVEPHMKLCAEMISVLNEIIDLEVQASIKSDKDESRIRQLLHSKNRHFGYGSKAWPAAMAKKKIGSSGKLNNRYQQKKAEYKQLVEALQPAHFFDGEVLEVLTADDLKTAIQSYSYELKRALK